MDLNFKCRKLQNGNLRDQILCEIGVRLGCMLSTWIKLRVQYCDEGKHISEAVDRQKVGRETDKLIVSGRRQGYNEFQLMNNFYFDSKKSTASGQKENLYVFVTKPNVKFVFYETNEGEDAEAAAFQMIVISF